MEGCIKTSDDNDTNARTQPNAQANSKLMHDLAAFCVFAYDIDECSPYLKEPLGFFLRVNVLEYIV